MTDDPVEVRRRLWLWDARFRVDMDPGAAVDALGGAIGEHPVVGLAAVAAGLVLVLVAPFLLLAVEVALLVVLTVAAVLTRFVLRRPWMVEARRRRDSVVLRQWQVRGFRRAGRAQRQLAALAENGGELPPSGNYDPDEGPSGSGVR